ncbi:TMEM175 family protein [Loigolactobacillus zhaoyuanensis]|uniref:TMEM175 family protein n=1 Tax=Loigolactobacillus zhaoyuanensis TaxID=2486017 RepID=A0ABW8UCK8_9LACO|nr:TMEM175 family protein [Loigolactobacillus zhaoyuanensis]
MKLSRLQAFSDGVFAILITILVMDFRVPPYSSGHLLAAVLRQWPVLAAYILSFMYIGILWLFHHDLFSVFAKIDRNVNLLNLLMLFAITLINYPTALLSDTLMHHERADLQVAFMSYAGVALFISLTFLLLYRYLNLHPELKSTRVNAQSFATITYDPLRSIVIYFLSIVATFFSVSFGALLLVGGIIFHFYAYLHLSRRLIV